MKKELSEERKKTKKHLSHKLTDILFLLSLTQMIYCKIQGKNISSAPKLQMFF